jgi:hypothetical protein
MDIIEQIKQETNIDKLREYSKSRDIKVLEALASNENINEQIVRTLSKSVGSDNILKIYII